MAGFSVVKRGLDPERDSRGLPSNVATANLVADFLGRTGVLNSSSDSAPTIVGQVSVTDAPWKAKGDTRVATDGVIAGGTLNQVSSTALALTSADVGKTVVVLNVGPNVAPGGVGPSVPGVFVSTVSSVAGGTATLAGSATLAGTGLTVKVGTLDTTAIQAAITAASARATAQGGTGVVKLVFPSGRHFLFSGVTAKSNVWVDFTGATLHCAAGNSTGLATNMMFQPAANVDITNWHLRGGTWAGTGTEAGAGGCQGVMYWVNYANGGSGTASYTDITVRDMIVTNWATGVIDIRGGSRLRISDNTFRNCSTLTGTNTINVIMGAGAGTVPTSDVFIQNNMLDSNPSECIAIGEAAATTSTFDRGVVTGNICRTTANNAAISIEWSTTTTGKGRSVLVANNIVQNTGTGVSAWCISVNSGSNTDPYTISRVLVANNIVDAADGGIQVLASEAQVAGNIITAGGVNLPAVRALGNQTVVSTANTNATTTVLNAPTNAAILNGCQLTGTNIAAGTYLVSGAGTSTWTISLAATGTTVGGAITADMMLQNVQIYENQIHTPSTSTTNPLNLTQVRDSKVNNNTITVDTGSTAGTVGVLLQRCGWTDVADNRIYNAATHGIQVDSSNDCNVLRNRIYNPSENGVGVAYGIFVSNMSGFPCRIKDNYIIDDRAAHKMQVGINFITVNVLTNVLDNEIRGATSAPIGSFSQIALQRGNITDQNTYPAVTSAITVTASPFTYTNADSYYQDVFVNGGTVGAIQLSRPGSSTRTLGSTSNLGVRLAPGESAVVTYTVAPTMVKIPLA